MEKQNTVIIKKIRKKSHAGGHGGSWKVAYADFVTAMMAFFLLLWLITMVAPEKRARVSNYFKEFSIFEKSGTSFLDLNKQNVISLTGNDSLDSPEEREPAPEKEQEGDPPTPQEKPAVDNREPLDERLRREVEAKLADIKDQIIIETFEGGVRIEIMDKDGNPMFPLSSAELTANGRKVLAVIADSIKDSDSKVALEGHTDARSYPSSNYSNWELSTERASAARKELERNGLLPRNLIRVAGYAATEPLIRENPFDPRNRRISILLFDNKLSTPDNKLSTPAPAVSIPAPVVNTPDTSSRQLPVSNGRKSSSDPIHQYLFYR